MTTLLGIITQNKNGRSIGILASDLQATLHLKAGQESSPSIKRSFTQKIIIDKHEKFALAISGKIDAHYHDFAQDVKTGTTTINKYLRKGNFESFSRMHNKRFDEEKDIKNDDLSYMLLMTNIDEPALYIVTPSGHIHEQEKIASIGSGSQYVKEYSRAHSTFFIGDKKRNPFQTLTGALHFVIDSLTKAAADAQTSGYSFVIADVRGIKSYENIIRENIAESTQKTIMYASHAHD